MDASLIRAEQAFVWWFHSLVAMAGRFGELWGYVRAFLGALPYRRRDGR
jgi:hypothetical protein